MTSHPHAEHDRKYPRAFAARNAALARVVVENHLVDLLPASEAFEKLKDEGAKAIPAPMMRAGTEQFLGFTTRAQSEIALRNFSDTLKSLGIVEDRINGLVTSLREVVDTMLGPAQGR